MNLFDTTRLARDLMKRYGLGDWQISFDGAKRRFGVCKYASRIISLSKPLVSVNSEADVRDVILHEIAHAMVGPGNGHNYTWMRKAIEIGAKPERCYDSDKIVAAPALYVGTCPGCGKQFTKHRMRVSKYSCNSCAPGKFDERFLISWKMNHV